MVQAIVIDLILAHDISLLTSILTLNKVVRFDTEVHTFLYQK